MSKVAIDAGHGLYTSGKRCLRSIDPNQTREWQLNSRIAGYVVQHLQAAGVQTVRTDDVTGQTDVPLSSRCSKANAFGADLFVSIHANAGIGGGAGGGVVIYALPNASAATRDWQADTYNQVIALTGLRGNRSRPLGTANYYVLKHTKAPALLCECGFMDSSVDTPIILTDDFARQCAQGIAHAVLNKLGIKGGAADPAPEPGRNEIEEGVFCDMKQFYNKGSYTNVYQDKLCKNKTGALDPNENCVCLLVEDGMALVVYTVTYGSDYAAGNKKTGWIKLVRDMRME